MKGKKMSRIDVQTLVLAFEKRIEMLEKNPPDKVPMNVILNLLDKAIDDVIRDHFVDLAKKDIEDLIKKELKNYHHEFIKKTVTNVLDNPIFRDEIENKFKKAIINGIEKLDYQPDRDY